MTVDVASSLKKMFVDGKWIESESGKTFDAISPATGKTIAQVPKGTRADAQRAVEAAHKARGAMAGRFSARYRWPQAGDRSRCSIWLVAGST